MAARPLVVPGPGEPNTALVATIANAASLSGTVQVPPGMSLKAILMPAAWTAAALTFQVSYDNVNFFNMFNETAEYSVASAAASASQAVMLDQTKWDSVRFLKVRSGTAAAPVAQGAQRLLTLVLLPSRS